jgi:hypothetical protein
MTNGDRFVRLGLAIVLLVLFFGNDYLLPVNTVLLTITLGFVVTACVASCPLYAQFRIDTKQFKH